VFPARELKNFDSDFFHVPPEKVKAGEGIRTLWHPGNSPVLAPIYAGSCTRRHPSQIAFFEPLSALRYYFRKNLEIDFHEFSRRAI
jgi:hypothetical protein